MGKVGEWLLTVRRRGVPILPEDLGQMELFHNQVALGGGDSHRSVVETLHQVPLHMGACVLRAHHFTPVSHP